MTVTIEVKAQAGKLQELYQTLQALLLTMRDEKGCRDCRVSRDVENGEVFLLFSDWELKGGFDGYMHSDNGRVLLGAIKLLGESARFRMSSDARWKEIGAGTFKGAKTGVEETLPSSVEKDIDSKEFLLAVAGSQKKKTEGHTLS
jgi:quinol monooxygenase YgiN